MGIPDAALPVLLALGAACMFGVSAVIAKRGLQHVDAQVGAIISIATTTALFALTAPWWMKAEYWFTAGFWVFFANGLIHPLLSMYLALEATARTGPTVSATFASTAPLFAALTAMVFLGESLNTAIALGTLATVAGVMTLSWSAGGVPMMLRAALLFATGAAVIRGLNHTIGKFGLELLPSAAMAAFVSFAVSLLGSALMYRIRNGPVAVRIPRPGLVCFLVTGSFIAVAILCMYSALFTGSVVVVSPIIAAYPLFTLLTALAFRQEPLSMRAIAGVCLVVGGVALISLGAADR
ncbi:MAG: DMT family transporter [Gammaproteobacteria bacterium]|nr:DMT family transporter [Gammaproteobacteria bacterium]